MQHFRCLCESDAQKRVEIFILSFLRIFQGCSVFRNGLEYLSPLQVELLTQKVVWMLGFQVVLDERIRRKIFEIERHYKVRLPPDRRGDDVSVIGVGNCYGLDEKFMSRNQTVKYAVVHKGFGAF